MTHSSESNKRGSQPERTEDHQGQGTSPERRSGGVEIGRKGLDWEDEGDWRGIGRLEIMNNRAH